MRQDVVDLRDFYATRLGQVARRMIRRQVRALWPDTAGMRVLGIGYPTPYLRPVRDSAERVMAVMPASQGVLHWPAAEPGQVCLAEEEELPFEDATFDRIIMVHALETSEQVRGLLREAWRVMAGNGRLLTVVPNRRGIWARLERTPFLCGERVTIADCRLLPQLRFFADGKADGVPASCLEAHPAILAWIKRMLALPQVKAWYAVESRA